MHLKTSIRRLACRCSLLVGLAVGIYPVVNAAIAAPDSLIYGFGIQLKVGIGRNQNSEFGFSASASVGKILYQHALVSYHLTANLYRGGLGNSLLPRHQNDYQLDMVNGFAITGGARHYQLDRPLYNWTPSNAPALTNPFGNSATLATNFIWNRQGRSQQVGFIGLTSGDISLGYYNDGPPFHLLGLGDANDRWWTGGGFLHWIDLRSKYQFVYYFDKFTGFQRNGYELANALRLNYVMYRDLETMTYNRGRNGIRVIHPSGLALNAELHNRYDVQNLIHRVLRYPFHPNAYQPILVLGTQYRYFGSSIK